MAEKCDDDNMNQCLRRIAAGEEAALSELYDATSHRVYGVALRILGNDHCAEEVVSDVYLQVWGEPGSYDPGRGPVIAWLLVMCRSRALDGLRSRCRRTRALPGLLEESVAERNDPQDLLEVAQSDAAVRAGVASLLPVQRQLVALAFFRGYSHSEIATFTGLPLGTVKTSLRSAIGQLRTKLAGRRGALHA